MPQIYFEWFNLSVNEIWIIDVTGLPDGASPGRLMPSHAEDQLETKASIFSEVVHIKDIITIEWKDNGKDGWRGGVEAQESNAPGEKHWKKFSRDKLGLPSVMKGGKVRFTYLGNDEWRVILVK